MKINLISKGCGQGKTQQALDLLAHTPEKYMLAMPSIRLITQSETDLNGKNADVRCDAITSNTSSGVGQQVRDAMARPGLLAQSPNVLLLTHAALMDLTTPDKGKWNLIVDEIPSATEHLEYQLKLTRRWVVRHLSISDTGVGDTYELVIKPGHIELVAAMLRDAKNDSLAGVLSELWRFLLHPHYRVYVTKAEWLLKGAKANGQVELNAHAVLQPSVFADFASVTLMGANARNSRLVQIWQTMGVEFAAHPTIPDSSHDQATGMRLSIQYFTNKAWTRGLRDYELKQHGFHVLVNKVAARLPSDYIWSANNRDSGKVETILMNGRKLPPVSHGLNAFRNTTTVVSLGSYNDDLAHAKFLTNAYQLSDQDLFRSKPGEMTYQLVMRTALRNAGDNTPVTAIVPDWRTAEYLSELLPSARVEHIDLGIDALKGAKPRFRVASTQVERNKKTRAKQASAVQRSNELLDLHRYGTGVLAGDVPIMVTLKDRVATRVIETLPLADWDMLYALLDSDRERKLPKDEAGLIVGSNIDPDAVAETVAGMANVLYTQFAWMDIDDGDISPAQASALLGDVKHLVYSSFNNGKVAGKHRFRVVVPLSKPVDAETYQGIWKVLANRFEQAGYWLPEKAGQEVPTNRPVSGLDYSKCKVSDFMYRPVRTADKTKNVWISEWAQPILSVDTFALALQDTEDELLDLWVEERKAQQAKDEVHFKGDTALLEMYRAQAAQALKRDAEKRVTEEFAAIPSGGVNQNLYRLAKWLFACGHTADEMYQILYGLLGTRSGGRDHYGDLKDIRDDAVRGRMRIAR